MPFKILAVCKICKNKSVQPCKACGKRRSQILFELNCIKLHEEFVRRVHKQMCEYKMESTGSASMDLEVLDCVGPWIPNIPVENPLYDFYERVKQTKVLHLHHLFKFRQVNYKDFVQQYAAYLKTNADEIRRIIEENKLNFVE